MEEDSQIAGYRVTPTTADLAVEAWGRDQADVFREGGLGLFSVLCDLETVAPRQSLACRVEGESPENLFVRWLNELIFLHEVHGFLACDIQIDRLTDSEVEGRLIGEPENRERHALGLEVKAATLHRLKVAQTPDGWQAYVILDV
jgi:SHS2 domain-containing protein